ncbi:MAG: hypothetical protein L7A77_10885, partial [Xylella fastidiosa subsp. multiplex]|nr:hypothetical protein [Xylella fastidiosa subsp. multiplex]
AALMPPHFPPYCTRLSGAMPSSNDLLAPCPPQQGFFFIQSQRPPSGGFLRTGVPPCRPLVKKALH